MSRSAGHAGRYRRPVPELRLKTCGTAPVKKASIIRNNKYVGEQAPGTAEVAFTSRDNSPLSRPSYYYVRVDRPTARWRGRRPSGSR